MRRILLLAFIVVLFGALVAPADQQLEPDPIIRSFEAAAVPIISGGVPWCARVFIPRRIRFRGPPRQ